MRSELLQRVFGERGARPLALLTAYDYPSARMAVMGGADALLVGDSLGMVIQGLTSTRGVKLEHMEYHTTLVARSAPEVPVIADLPFGTYETPTQAVANAQRLIQAGAHAVKFEGNPQGIAQALAQEGIPFMGHVGLLPQTAESYSVRGRDQAEAQRILEEAQALERRGAFALVVECVPSALGQRIQDALTIPVIGIGAGGALAGQVLVIHDLWQLPPAQARPRFVPVRYPAGGELLVELVRRWVEEVRSGAYPQPRETYG